MSAWKPPRGEATDPAKPPVFTALKIGRKDSSSETVEARPKAAPRTNNVSPLRILRGSREDVAPRPVSPIPTPSAAVERGSNGNPPYEAPKPVVPVSPRPGPIVRAVVPSEPVMVTDINPDHNVVKSMNDVVAAQKDRQAQIARAEAEKNAAILRAEGEARTRELEGAGIAAQRRRIVEGLQESVTNFKQALPNADPNHLLTTVLMTQYLDVLKEAASHGKNTFILPSSPAHIQAIEGQIGMALLGTAPANAQNVANARQAERQA